MVSSIYQEVEVRILPNGAWLRTGPTCSLSALYKLFGFVEVRLYINPKGHTPKVVESW